MGLPFVTFAAQINGYIVLRHKQRIASGVRRMTAYTITGFDWFTKIFIFGIFNRPFLQFYRVAMTPPADDRLSIYQKFFLFGAVRVVAVQTPVLLPQRPVQTIFTEDFLDHAAVTIAT